MSTSEYAHPEALVDTAWIAQHLNDPKVRIIESNEDVSLYDTGHIPGAVHVDWHKDLNDQSIRDFLDPEHFAALVTAERLSIASSGPRLWQSVQALSKLGHFLGSSPRFPVPS